MKRIMMIAAVAATAGLLFVACKNDKKGEAAPAQEIDVEALQPGQDLDWEQLSRQFAEAEAIEPEAEEFAEEEIEAVEDVAEEAAEFAEAEINEFGEIEADEAVEELAEEVAEEIAEEEVPATEYFAVAKKPSYNGGDANAFTKWVAQNVQYPEAAKAENAQGTVVVKFTIGKDGHIRNTHVIKSSGNALLDAEACRTIAGAPQWEPGYDSEGNAVRTNLVMPVVFKLQ